MRSRVAGGFPESTNRRLLEVGADNNFRLARDKMMNSLFWWILMPIPTFPTERARGRELTASQGGVNIVEASGARGGLVRNHY